MFIESGAVYSVVGLIFIISYGRQSNVQNLVFPSLEQAIVSVLIVFTVYVWDNTQRDVVHCERTYYAPHCTRTRVDSRSLRAGILRPKFDADGETVHSVPCPNGHFDAEPGDEHQRCRQEPYNSVNVPCG